MNALDSGSEFNVKEALKTHGKKLIRDLRAHKAEEDEILYRIPEELNYLSTE